jgi:hypothetical protein
MWTKIQCLLVGWNKELLTSCTEASRKRLKKYVSALIILMILWAFTGYCFADRYLQASLSMCILVSLVFVVLLVHIERQIILTVGKVRLAWIVRFVIAVLMSLLSSSIIDQIIFKDDIEKKMIEITDRQVVEQLPNRMADIDTKLRELQADIDSLELVNINLNAEYVKNPTIKTVTSNTEHKTMRKVSGVDTLVAVTNYTRTDVPNPVGKRIEHNDETIGLFRKQQEEYTAKKLDAANSLREEISSKKGFLEELNTIIQIMRERIEALIFYLVLFCFLLFIELFIVVSKFADGKCDYDEKVEHQLSMTLKALGELRK